MKIYIKILIILGVVHFSNGTYHKPNWGKWVSAGNQITSYPKRTPIKKRICKICGKKQIGPQ